MECPNCEKDIGMPPEAVLKQMQNLVRRWCHTCNCYLQLNQKTQEVTVYYDPSKED